MMNTYILILFFAIYSTHSSSQLASTAPIDSSTTVIIDSLLALSSQYAEGAKLDSAVLYANEVYDISENLNYSIGMAHSRYSLGYAYDLGGQLDKAVEHYESARLLFDVIDNKTEVANCMNAKGVAASFKGDYDIALTYLLPTIAYCEDHGISDVLINALNNTGVIYRITDRLNEAIRIYSKTLALSKETDNKSMIGTSYHNLGVAYNFLNQPIEAISYLDSAIATYQLIEDAFEQARSIVARGETYYLSLKDYDHAREDFQSVLQLIEKSGDQEVLLKTYLLLAQNERDSRRYSKSEDYFLVGLELIEGTDRNDLKSEYYLEMVELYETQGDINQSYSLLQKHLELYKIIQSGERMSAIAELQTKYETTQKEQEIKLLSTQNDLQKIRLTTSRNTVIILVGGIILLGGLIYRLWILNQQVQQSRDEKDTLLREIHHRVKNNLQVISALLTLQSTHLKDAQAKTALQEGQDRVQSMALIHKDLYQHDNLKGVNTKDYFVQLIDNLLRSYKIDESKVQLVIDIQEINLDVDSMIPMGLMVNELISNALKHAFHNTDNGIISISLKEESNMLKMIISDNGVGVLDIDRMKSQSFGYSLVQSFARKLDAELSFDSQNGLKIQLEIKNYKKV